MRTSASNSGYGTRDENRRSGDEHGASFGDASSSEPLFDSGSGQFGPRTAVR